MLQPVDGALELVDLDRGGVDLHLEPAGRLVDQVDGLVRQLAAGDVAVAEGCGGDQRGVGDRHPVVRLVALLEPAQDGDGVFDARLADVHLLEAALERGILLDVLAVLVEGGRADQAQLAAGEHGLEHVGCRDRALAAAGAHEGVQLVDEGDDLALGVVDLLEHGLEPLLELAAVLGAGDERGQVERDEPLALERVGDIARDDALGEPLDHGGLADAGFPDQHGVVLGAPGEHLADPADLGVAPDHRVELAGAGDLGEVDAVLLQCGLLLLVGGGGALHVRHPCHYSRVLVVRLSCRSAVLGRSTSSANEAPSPNKLKLLRLNFSQKRLFPGAASGAVSAPSTSRRNPGHARRGRRSASLRRLDIEAGVRDRRMFARVRKHPKSVQMRVRMVFFLPA